MRDTIYQLIAYLFYPLWLAGGGVDYLCHRRSAIERTSGFHESLYHLAQFITIAAIVICIALFAGSLAIFAVLVGTVLLHTLLSYFDVRFTERRRYISPLEQHAHAAMDILPIVVVALVIVLEWHSAAFTWAVRLRSPMLEPAQLVIVIGTIVVGAGAPVLEELWRTGRRAKRANDDHIGFATIK
jgi:hypothetical protein